jgi:hypothetical protein
LARDHSFGTIVLPVRTEVTLRPDGTPSTLFLGEDATLDGHLCRGKYPRGWVSSFFPNGRLRSCYVAKLETIDGIPCRAGSFWGEVTGGVVVVFHDNGRLQACRLAGDVTITGRTFRDGARIELDAAGVPVTTSAGGAQPTIGLAR